MITSLHPNVNKFKYGPLAILTGSALFSGSIFALVLNRDKWVTLPLRKQEYII